MVRHMHHAKYCRDTDSSRDVVFSFTEDACSLQETGAFSRRKVSGRRDDTGQKVESSSCAIVVAVPQQLDMAESSLRLLPKDIGTTSQVT